MGGANALRATAAHYTRRDTTGQLCNDGVRNDHTKWLQVSATSEWARPCWSLIMEIGAGNLEDLFIQ